MLRSVSLACFTILLASSVASLPAHAQNKSRLTFTDIQNVDEDFAWQGEYLGNVQNRYGHWELAGLQVIARGDGEFEGVLYSGGLPGYGWYGQGEKTRFSGAKEGDVLTLSADDQQIRIRQATSATLHTQTGAAYAGQLNKVSRVSPTLGATAPWNAIVLFDGTNTEHFKDGKMTEDGLLQVGTQLKDSYTDFTLHLEFRLPYMPYARGQARANSGVYLQSRYELQILDSFGLEGEKNECGGLYKQRSADVNMCLPPLAWQTYDIDFTAARFDDEGNKTSDARITARHNGVVIHNDVAVPNKTGAGAKEGPQALPTKLQNHSNPVVFRNIWLVDRSANSQSTDPSFAAAPPAVGYAPYTVQQTTGWNCWTPASCCRPRRCR